MTSDEKRKNFLSWRKCKTVTKSPGSVVIGFIIQNLFSMSVLADSGGIKFWDNLPSTSGHFISDS